MLRFTKREEIILLVIIITLVIGSGIIAVKYFTGTEAQKAFITDSGEKEAVQSKQKQHSESNKTDNILVQVGGEVNQPGVYKLSKGSRVFKLLDKAGGTTSKANLDQMNLVKELDDGEKIIVPHKVTAKELEEEKSGETAAVQQDDQQQVKENKINLNTASKQELKKLYRIGSVLADKIIKYRDQHGGFKEIVELKKVSRIGEQIFQHNKERLTVQ